MASEQFGKIDDSIPQWKKDIILRRRALGRSSSASTTRVQVTCSSVVSSSADVFVRGRVSERIADTMRLADQASGNVNVCLVPDIRDLMTKVDSNNIKHRSKMGEEKNGNNKHNTNGSSKEKIQDDDDGASDSSEELQYGPGIVSKLKTRYLSLTLRESQHKTRPNLNVFRRAASLENLLDETDTTVKENVDNIVKNSFNKNPNVVNGVRFTGRGLSRGNESMKRARSVDALSRYDRSEQNINRCSLEENELPPPDLVKETLKIFERSPSKLNRLKNLKKAPENKPVLSPKPVIEPEEVVKEMKTDTINGDYPPVVPRRQLSTDKQVKPEVAKRTKEFRKSSSFEKIVSPLEKSPIFKNLKNSTSDDENLFSKTEDKTDETDKAETKQVSSTVIKNIRKDSTTVDFKFNDVTNKTYLPNDKPVRPSSMDLTNNVVNNKKQSVEVNLLPTTRPISPVLVKAPPSILSREIISSPMKQVGVIRPIVTNKTVPTPKSYPTSKYSINLTDQEVEKNYLNKVKSIEQPVTKVIVSLKKSPEECLVVNNIEDEKKSINFNKKTTTNSNTMIFNFSDRSTVPDYIENDGLILCNKKDKPKAGDGGVIFLGGGTGDSSTDFENEDSSLDYSDPLSPCGILFEGDNVLINGKSNLRKEPKQRKLRIQFNDQATTLFEYPSEASLLDDTVIQQQSTTSSQGMKIPLGNSSLASYTPSKVAIDNDFQLGVTRTTPLLTTQATPTIPMIDDNSDNEEYLKPADDKDTVVWSAGTAADLLF